MNLSFEKLNALDKDEVLNGLICSFAKYEVMSSVLQLEPSDLKPVFETIINDSVNTSFVAKDISNNKIAGAIICNDFSYFSNLTESHFNSKGMPIESLLVLLENNFLKSEFHVPNKSNHTFYLYATYVNDDYGNKGISTRLFNIAEQYAFDNGYKNILTIPTGPSSQHISINKLTQELILADNLTQFNKILFLYKIV
jgi:hypothetical protein